MNRLKLGVLSFASFLFLLFASQTFAGGGLVELSSQPSGTRLHPGGFYTVYAKVYADNSYTNMCQNCPITFRFQDQNSSDVISPNSATTDSNGLASARMTSNILGDRLVFVNVKLPDGNMTMSSFYVLGYNQSSITQTPQPISLPGPPNMVYPIDGQTLDLEGAYMFKVTPVTGATGYLFGLFQNGTMLYENYRDGKTLSGTEFALWESNSYHKKFKEGPVKVMIRALVNNQWTDAREITINLKSRGGQASNTVSTSTVKPTTTTTAKPPALVPSQTVVIVQDSSAAAELAQKVEDLEKQLEESQIRQSELEVRLNQLVEWVKSIFPFFN